MISSLEIVKVTEDLEGEVLYVHPVRETDNSALIDTYKFNLELRAAAVHKLNSNQYFIREVETV